MPNIVSLRRSIRRIKAIFLQEFFLTFRSFEVINDVIVLSVLYLVLFGFISNYLLGSHNSLTGQYLLLGTLFWELTRIPQYSISVGCLWNIWSRNLSNMFVAPISPAEYLTALSISGLVKSLLMFVIDGAIVSIFFHFSVWQIPIWMLLLFWVNIFVFSITMGIVIMGWIFRYGVRVQAFAWSIMPVLQPLTAALFPLNVLPSPLKEFALIFPITHVFEAARQSLTTHVFNWQEFGIACGLNILYFVGSILYFSHMYKEARNSGQFARNEG